MWQRGRYGGAIVACNIYAPKSHHLLFCKWRIVVWRFTVHIALEWWCTCGIDLKSYYYLCWLQVKTCHVEVQWLYATQSRIVLQLPWPDNFQNLEYYCWKPVVFEKQFPGFSRRWFWRLSAGIKWKADNCSLSSVLIWDIWIFLQENFDVVIWWGQRCVGFSSYISLVAEMVQTLGFMTKYIKRKCMFWPPI